MVLHYKIKVVGKVQGVWFRDSTRSKALELSIKGFVRNESDGSVYIEAEGDKNGLQQLVDWCQTGPELARVDKVVVEDGAIEHFVSFEIRKF